MTDEEFLLIAGRARESRNIEFKSGGPTRNDHLLRKVLRAVLGMTNNQDGGIVILGVDENLGHAEFVGMTSEDAQTWSQDSFGDKCANWVDPAVSVEIEMKRYLGRYFVVIEVAEFFESPVFARKGYQSPQGDMVFREGALYVRGVRKPETIEVRTSEEMRRLLSLALEKRLAEFYRLTAKAGYIPPGNVHPSDEERFAKQVQDFSK